MALQTRADMETELLAQLQVANNSSMFPSARLTQLIKNAHTWATNLFVWVDLVRAKCTSTVSGQEYYDYPAEFRSGTIMRLEIDGESYKRKSYEDYLDFRENNPGSTLKIFANYGRFFFIHPTPTLTGSNNMSIWGAIQADDLSQPTSTTIFSDNKEQGNEAIVRKGLSVALKRIDPKLSQTEEAQATTILAKLNFDEAKSTQRDQRIQHPKFIVPDFYSGNGGNPIGNFDTGGQF